MPRPGSQSLQQQELQELQQQQQQQQQQELQQERGGERLVVLVRLELGCGKHQGKGRLVVRASDGVLSAALRSEVYAHLAAAPIAS
ncbi:hypothetical protein Emag_001124 [Eimeria magna]